MKQKGFTLVEVVVSLMLLLILAAGANTAVDTAEAQRTQTREALQQAEESRTQLYAGQYDPVDAPAEVTYRFSYFTVTATAQPVQTQGGSRYVLFQTPAPTAQTGGAP